MKRAHTRDARLHAVVLLTLVALLAVSYATLVARESHASAFERDCPACRLSSAGVAEQAGEVHFAVPIVTSWYTPSECSWETSEPLILSELIRAPPA